MSEHPHRLFAAAMAILLSLIWLTSLVWADAAGTSPMHCRGGACMLCSPNGGS